MFEQLLVGHELGGGEDQVRFARLFFAQGARERQRQRRICRFQECHVGAVQKPDVFVERLAQIEASFVDPRRVAGDERTKGSGGDLQFRSERGRGAWVQRGEERQREGFVHQAY